MAVVLAAARSAEGGGRGWTGGAGGGSLGEKEIKKEKQLINLQHCCE